MKNAVEDERQRSIFHSSAFDRPAIKVGLGFAPPLQFAGARTLLGGLILLLVLVIRRKSLWPEARLALHPGNDLMSLTAWQLVAGSVVLLGLSPMFEPHQTITWTGGFVGLLLFLALAGTALSTWLWFWLLQRAEAGHLSLYLFLVPVSGLLIAMSGFGERLNFLQAGGAALISSSVALSVLEGRFGAGKPPQRETSPPTN